MFIVGKRIRERLIALEKNPEDGGQTWLASEVGMKPQGIQSILAGGVERPRKLREIASTLRTTQEYLLGETADPSIPEADTTKVSGERAVKELLRRIDKLPEAAIEPVWGLITFYLPKDAAPQESSRDHGQSEPPSHRRGSRPSKQRPLPSDA